MPDITQLPLFIVASVVLLLTPGPAFLYIVARSVDQGRRAGLVSVCAIELGNFMHVIAATLGLSALLLSSAVAFTILKFLGAAYLIYLGLRKLLTRAEIPATVNGQPKSLRRTFSQGVMVATLNPKTALFFVAFLPQFVDLSRGSIAIQMLVLGCIFVSLAVISDSMYRCWREPSGSGLKVHARSGVQNVTWSAVCTSDWVSQQPWQTFTNTEKEDWLVEVEADCFVED